MRKIVIAPDSFKESLSASEVAEIIAGAFRDVFPEAKTVCIPLADGGEGTAEALKDAFGGEWVHVDVQNPLGKPHRAKYAYVPNHHHGQHNSLAIIEMAEASGLSLVDPEERNPMITTTYGTGELILDALNRGATEIIVGIGGSATNDAGMGMMRALGAEFLDHAGEPIPCGGAALASLAKIDLSNLDPRLQTVEFRVACDVTNPLVGSQGASAVFAPQKGATPRMVDELDAALCHYGSIVQSQMGINIVDTAGGGAAGGMGSAFLTFFGRVALQSGIDIVVEAVELAEHVSGADLVITGEGRMDSQTQFGKTPMGAQKVAELCGVPVIGIAGSLGDRYEELLDKGFTALFDTTTKPCELDEALQNASENLYHTALSVARLIKMRVNFDFEY